MDHIEFSMQIVETTNDLQNRHGVKRTYAFCNMSDVLFSNEGLFQLGNIFVLILREFFGILLEESEVIGSRLKNILIDEPFGEHDLVGQ